MFLEVISKQGPPPSIRCHERGLPPKAARALVGLRGMLRMTHVGSCFCDAVEVKVTGEPVAVGYCP